MYFSEQFSDLHVDQNRSQCSNKTENESKKGHSYRPNFWGFVKHIELWITLFFCVFRSIFSCIVTLITLQQVYAMRAIWWDLNKHVNQSNKTAHSNVETERLIDDWKHLHKWETNKRRTKPQWMCWRVDLGCGEEREHSATCRTGSPISLRPPPTPSLPRPSTTLLVRFFSVPSALLQAQVLRTALFAVYFLQCGSWTRPRSIGTFRIIWLR